MEHRFTGPSFTLGIEEELMIVDQETLDLTNSIEGLLADLAHTNAEGDVKPELMESVCEIATTPCQDAARGGPPARRAPTHRPVGGLREGVWRSARRAPTRSRCGRTSGSSRARATAT